MTEPSLVHTMSMASIASRCGARAFSTASCTSISCFDCCGKNEARRRKLPAASAALDRTLPTASAALDSDGTLGNDGGVHAMPRGLRPELGLFSSGGSSNLTLEGLASGSLALLASGSMASHTESELAGDAPE